MHPILLRIGNFSLDTYNVLWLIALSLAISWSVRRFSLYGVDDGEARRVIGWAFLAMLFGAAVAKPLINFRFFAAQPSLILTQGGLSEIGAVLGAFFAAALLCWRNPKISFQRLCDVVALPAFLAIAVGRWGCFLNGCCVGIVTDFPLAVHFPRDASGVLRHATQLYYSAFALAALLILLAVERALLRRAPATPTDRPYRAVIAPLSLLLYILMRFSIDLLRAPVGPLASEQRVPPNLVVVGIALPFVCTWLVLSLRSLRARLLGNIAN